jgi:hypothetical protein
MNVDPAAVGDVPVAAVGARRLDALRAVHNGHVALAPEAEDHLPRERERAAIPGVLPEALGAAAAAAAAHYQHLDERLGVDERARDARAAVVVHNDRALVRGAGGEAEVHLRGALGGVVAVVGGVARGRPRVVLDAGLVPVVPALGWPKVWVRGGRRRGRGAW